MAAVKEVTVPVKIDIEVLRSINIQKKFVQVWNVDRTNVFNAFYECTKCQAHVKQEDRFCRICGSEFK